MFINDKANGLVIERITFEDDCSYRVGIQSGITSIEAYHENGEMAPVVWFNVWKGEFLLARVNSKYISVVEYRK